MQIFKKMLLGDEIGLWHSKGLTVLPFVENKMGEANFFWHPTNWSSPFRKLFWGNSEVGGVARSRK